MTATSAAGYSGTPLAKKLGIRQQTELAVLGAPAGYRELLAPLPDDVRFSDRVSKASDLVHVFATRRADLGPALARLRKQVRADAAVWVSWPKKTARVDSDLSEDAIRELALPLGFVDIKVCAVSDVWSGLKLVIRKELR